MIRTKHWREIAPLTLHGDFGRRHLGDCRLRLGVPVQLQMPTILNCYFLLLHVHEHVGTNNDARLTRLDCGGTEVITHLLLRVRVQTRTRVQDGRMG